jgi:hypothetical protein
MTSRLLVLFVLFAAAIARLEAEDSITTLDKLSVFGRVTAMDKDTVTLVARFPSAESGTPVREETLTLKRVDLLRIEFNRTTVNPGGPPSIGLKPPDGLAAQPPAARPPADTVILVGGERRECEPTAIRDEKLYCGTEVLDRGKVIRILLGSR